MLSLHQVSAVIPLKSWKEETVDASVNAVQSEETGKHDSSSTEWLPKVDLSHLTPEQRTLIEKLLIKLRDVFSKSDSDIGSIEEFQMKINMTDNVPVKEVYRRIPHNLYAEVKNYLHDLLVNGWVRESFSAYASPIVCVRKKDGSLRMCVDYRKLNLKIVPDSQPIPRVQDIIDGLGGQEWFSTLDMSKAYHPGFRSGGI